METHLARGAAASAVALSAVAAGSAGADRQETGSVRKSWREGREDTKTVGGEED